MSKPHREESRACPSAVVGAGLRPVGPCPLPGPLTQGRLHLHWESGSHPTVRTAQVPGVKSTK